MGHSRSPAMQNAALAAAGLAGWRYQLLPVAPPLLREVVAALPGAGFAGANVTLPHKLEALALATDPTARAAAIGAANTLVFDGEGVYADNTDAPALIASLPFPVAGATALVLGAGGSARGAVWALADAGAADILVWNRTPDRARELCDELGGRPTPVATPADVLVNCTAAGLDGASPFDVLPLTPDRLDRYRCVVDFVYGPHESLLLAQARARNVDTVDGLDLLVKQGALSFERFTSIAPDLDVMRAAIGSYRPS